MEGLKKSAYIFCAVMVIGGAFAHMGGTALDQTHDEKWMEKHSLSSFGHYRMIPGDSGLSDVTYKMDAGSYAALNPSGIVCRQFTDGSKTFDVVLVASQAKDSFHDPRICFTAQGWNLENESSETLPTRRGPIPFRVASITSSDSKRWAAFGYREPNGFVDNTNRLKWDLFTYSLLHAKPGEGVFYRFIGISPNVDRETLMKFIQQYMNASVAFSKGYF